VLVQAPQDEAGKFVPLESPRYISADTIAFTADGSIWTVPADCDNCTLDDATELIPGSFDDDTGIGAVAWTSKTVQPGTAPPPPPPTGGTGGNGGGGATTQPQPQPSPQPAPIPQPAPAPISPPLKLPGGTLKARKGKLRLSLTCGAGTTSCHGTLILTGRKHSSLGHVAYAIAAGKKKTITLKLTGAARKALAKAHGHKLKVLLTAKPAGGRATSRTLVLKG
jgi:hypothetical protein